MAYSGSKTSATGFNGTKTNYGIAHISFSQPTDEHSRDTDISSNSDQNFAVKLEFFEHSVIISVT